MANSKTKTTLKDEAILTIHKSQNERGKDILSYQYSNSRIFPGSDKYKWCFSYSPAKNALSDKTEKNHVRLSLNFVPAVEGRFTIEAKGLPTKSYEFPKLNNYEWFYASHNDVLAAIDDVLELKCTVEIDVDVVPKIDKISEIDSHQKENSVEDSSSSFEDQKFEETKKILANIIKIVTDFETKSKKDMIPENPPVNEASSSAFMSSGQQSVERKVKEPLTDKICISLRKSVSHKNTFFNPITTDSILHDGSNEYIWSVTYNHDKDLCVLINEIIIEFCAKGKNVNAKVIVEGDGLQTMTYPITGSGIFTFKHLPYEDVFNAIHHTLHLKCTLVINGTPDENVPPHKYVPTRLFDYIDLQIPTDFEVHCGDEHYKVHKEGLIKLSPVFEAMIQQNTDPDSNKIEINDFDFKTVEATLNCCYWRNCGKISVELAIDVVRFVEKYVIDDVFSLFETIIELNVSITNFWPVLYCAIECDRVNIFAKCAEVYKRNEDTIKNDERFLALPGFLVAKLLKFAFNYKLEFDVYLYARKNGLPFDIEDLEVTTSADFFRTAPYAWQYYEDDLKLKCAKFWYDNKNILEKTQEFQLFPREIKDSLNVLATCFEVDKLSV